MQPELSARTILVMEQFLGRPLLREEHIHHKNGNKLDNRIENLQIMSNSEHLKLHHKKWNKLKNESKKYNI